MIQLNVKPPPNPTPAKTVPVTPPNAAPAPIAPPLKPPIKAPCPPPAIAPMPAPIPPPNAAPPNVLANVDVDPIVPVLGSTNFVFPAIDCGLNLSGDQSFPNPSGVKPLGFNLSAAEVTLEVAEDCALLRES